MVGNQKQLYKVKVQSGILSNALMCTKHTKESESSWKKCKEECQGVFIALNMFADYVTDKVD